MHHYSKVSFALVACWLFAVTVVSNFLTFSSSSTTGSVEVLSETSLQSVVSAPSTEFTVLEFYTLMTLGATPANTASFTAVVNYPEIATVAVVLPVVSFTALITSPFSILASVTPPASRQPWRGTSRNNTFSPRYNLEKLKYLDLSAQIQPYTYPCAFNCTCIYPRAFTCTLTRSCSTPT